MFALLWFSVPAAAVLGVIALFMHLHQKNRAGWNAEEPVMVDRAGAYRSSQKVVGIVERIRDVPTEVQVAAIVALFFGIMWIPSIPLVGVGMMVEADEGAGLATLFGIPGILLSIAHLVLGIRFTKRSAAARGLARGVSIWSLVHNLALLGLTLGVNLGDHPSKSLDLLKLEKGVGAVVVVYALCSIGYALFALRAAKIHEALDLLGRVDEPVQRGEQQVILPAPPVVPIAATPLPFGEGKAWP